MMFRNGKYRLTLKVSSLKALKLQNDSEYKIEIFVRLGNICKIGTEEQAYRINPLKISYFLLLVISLHI